jgi:N-acylneuraminate cytidylyltransferase
MVKFSSDNCLELVNPPKSEVMRRQDAPDVFDITTVVYVALPDFILKKYGIFSGKVTSVTVPKERAVDIDDIYDFKLAEVIVREVLNDR